MKDFKTYKEIVDWLEQDKEERLVYNAKSGETAYFMQVIKNYEHFNSNIDDLRKVE